MVTAARLSASCSGRLAPMIGAVMAGLDRTQASDKVARLMPASGRQTAQPLDRLKLLLFPVTLLVAGGGCSKVKRVPSGGGALVSYFPVSSPPASGL